MNARAVFLVDVDNTLLDNDAIERDLQRHIAQEFGDDARARYWDIFEELRAELGYADYLGTLQRYRVEHIDDPRLIGLSLFLLDYPFVDRLYEGALETLRHLREHGPTVILSDGDVVFQPRKIARAGLWRAVDGQVLIYIHKEQELDQVARLYPAERYVMIDDKRRILAAMKAVWGARLTTVQPRQGHYALRPDLNDQYPPADVTVDRIADVREALRLT